MQGAYGWASREMGAPMRPELSLPVGSNTKLMTAVAVMQLQARRGEVGTDAERGWSGGQMH